MEKRRYQRTELKSKIIIKQLDNSVKREVTVEVSDISRAGAGFDCTEPLAIGGIYEAFLTIWTKEVIHCFLEIVRIQKREEYFEYGATFVGMPEMDSKRIEIYQQVEDLKKD